MKKILISLLAVCTLLLSTQAQAQTQKYYKQIHPNEISASYGVSLLGIGIGTVVNKLDDVRSWLGITDDLVVKSGGTKGVLNLGYTYQLSKVVSIGGAVGLNSMKIKLEDQTGKIDAATANLWLIMSSAKFDWFRTRSDVFGMYSKVNLGLMLLDAKLMEDQTLHKTVPLPTGHLTLIGLEVGKGFSGFLELGMGMQGIVQVGVKARF